MIGAWLLLVLAACELLAPPPATVPPASEPVPDEAPAPEEPRDPLAGLSVEARAERLRELGAGVYSADGAGRCEVCHGPDGQGMRGAIPPLIADRPWAGDCLELASTVLFGANETLVRDGLTYVTVMPPQDGLDDLQIAAVSTFLIGRWGTGPACEPADVAVVRLQGPMSRVP